MAVRSPIVVLGMMTKMPVAGVVWQTLHYLLGFTRLGYETYYVETHGRTPSMLMRGADDDASARAATFIATILRRFGFGDRWAFRSLHDGDASYGMSRERLAQLYGSAALLLNLHGGTAPLEDLSAGDRLVYVETDPVQPQVELAQGIDATVEFLDQHCAFFTFAENYGASDCGVPVSDRYDFRTTRQPVVCDLWGTQSPPAHDRFTTIGNWRQHWRDVSLDGETYTWSKHEEFEKFLGLPERLGPRFELALGSYADDDRALLERHGWRIERALDFSMDLERYRRYVARSYGEFTVAKDQNVRLRSGWFSDRSATYLASGRPVITQDTGFGRALPTGEGLFPFASAEDVEAAVVAIDADPAGHRRAARDIAREFFEAERVLADMLHHVGLDTRGAAGAARPSPFPPDMLLTPTSRRPLTLPDATIETIQSTPPARAPLHALQARPAATIVIISCDGLLFTRLCLETVLAHTDRPAAEVVVVDNGSTDGSVEWLEELAARDRRVRLVENPRNIGFPAACNQGLALARGSAVVLLNNDTMVPRGWLERLLAPLSDERIGLAGAVTNRIGNEAEVPTEYETWGGFLKEAAQRARSHRGMLTDIPTVTMFCMAMRTSVAGRLGPLDDGYGIGTLEDDDYSLRARRAGYRLVCAEDVLVHHFGEASFGKLYADGDHSRVLERNRARFERKWGEPWLSYERRTDPAYEALVEEMRERLPGVVPAGARLLVVSKGDSRLIDVPGRSASHFPAGADGAWSGHHPRDSADAIAQLDAMLATGASHLVVPRPSLWWLSYYEDFARHLERKHQLVLRNDSCAVYALARPDGVARDAEAALEHPE